MDKEDITELEIGLIFDELRFLTESVDKARKGWKETVEKVLIGGTVIVTAASGIYVAAKLTGKDKI